MDCPTCGLPSPDDAKSCPECGSDLGFELSTSGREPEAEDPRPSSASSDHLPTQFHPELASGEIEPPASSAASAAASSGTGSESKIRRTFLEVGTVLANRYEIVELLGKGGMGEVYKAKDRELDILVALKTIRGDRVEDAEAVGRFKQELMLAREISHRNVVRLYDLGESDDLKFLTMEFIDGEDLRSYLVRRGPLPPEEAIRISRDLLSALQEAHSKGIIHRDLKPQNVMMETDGTARIMDFGIARSTSDTGMTATGSIIGSPDYMSPEQAAAKKANAPSDIFSFGVILYEMLTGRLPFEADTPFARIMARLNQKPPSPRELRENLPDYLEKVVMRCLERDEVLRYQNVIEVLADLDRQQVSRTFSASILRARRSVARNRAGWVAVAAVGLLAVAAAWYFLDGRKAASPDTEALPVAVTRLGILPFTNATGAAEHEWMRTALPEMLVTDMAQSQYLRPLPTERMLTVVRQLGIDLQTRFGEPELKRITEEAKVDALLHGQFVESGGTLRLDLTLRKAGSGVPLPFEVEGSSGDVFALVDRITNEIRKKGDMGSELAAEEDRPIAEVMTSSLDALRAYRKGVEALRAGATQEAVSAFQSATEADETFAVAWAKLGDAYLSAGQDHDAVAAVDRASELADQQQLPLAERYQIHATQARLNDDYETAAESYRELSALYPEDPDVHTSLALIYEEMGRFKEAGDAYAKALELEPDSAEARFGLAWARLSTGDPQECIRLLDEPLESGTYEGQPEALGMLHSILGVAYQETAEFDQALGHLEKSYHYREEAGDYRGQHVSLNNLSKLYTHLGRIDEAIERQEQALQLARKIGDREGESNALFDKAETYKLAHRFDQALEALDDSMQIERERQDDANLALRLTSMGDIFRQKGQYNQALVYLEQAQGLLDRTHQANEVAANLIYIGMVKKEQGLYGEALEAFLESLSIAESAHEPMAIGSVHRLLGEIYNDQGRYQDALTSMSRSLELFTQIHAEHDIGELKPIYGGLLVRLGRFEEAEKELGDALKMAEGEHGHGLAPELLLARAELASLRGDLESAAADYRQANEQANVSQKWEVAVRSRVALGHLYLEEDQRGDFEGGNPLGILELALKQSQDARLRPLEAEAEAGLAEVYLARGDAESAFEHAQRAVTLARKLEARPTLLRAYTFKGEAEERLGRDRDATASFAEAARVLLWMRGSLSPESVGPFTARPDLAELAAQLQQRLEAGGRQDLAQELAGWKTVSPEASAA